MEIKRTSTKKALLAKIALGLGGLSSLAGCGGEIISANGETFQGYHVDRSEGKHVLVFDEETIYTRQNKPSVRAMGNPENFEIGQKYDLELKRNFLGDYRIIDSRQSN